MRSDRRFVRLTIVAFILSSVAAPAASAQKEDIGLLFRKVLVADPADYASIRKAIIDGGEAAAAFLERRAEKGSTWYERSIASALRLAIISPRRYQRYQAEFEKLARHRYPPPWFDRTGSYGWRESALVEDGTQAVPFLIEKAFTELPCKVRDRTVIGWHESRPGQTAFVLLQCIGGKDAARAVAAAVIAGSCVHFSLRPGDGRISGSPSPETVAKASALPDSQLVDALVPLLSERGARPMAAWALGELKDPRAIPALIDTLTTYDVGECHFPAEALVKFGDPSIVPLLRAAATTSSPETLSWAKYALGKLGAPVAEAQRRSLLRGQTLSREEAILSIGVTGGEDAVIKCLAEIWPGSISDERALKLLVSALTSHDIRLCLPIANALVEAGQPAVPHLREALSSSKAETRSWAGWALSKMGKTAIPALLRVLREGPPVAHYHAARALRFIGDRQAVPALIEALESNDLSAVGEAAIGLGEIGDDAAREPLLKALENPRNWHASAIFGIAEALAKFKEARAFETLAKLCQHDDWLIRRAAIGALPAVGGEKSLAILLELTNHEHKATRGDAVISLGHLRDPRGIPVLIHALTDSETFVSSWAAWALGEIGDPSALPSLRRASESGNRDMKRIATEAIKKIEAATSKRPRE